MVAALPRGQAAAMTRRLALSLMLVLALAAAGAFATGLARSAGGWGDAPAAPEGWMTPRYVARTWNLAPDAVARALGLPMDGTGRRTTLEGIAEDRGVPLADILVVLAPLIDPRAP